MSVDKLIPEAISKGVMNPEVYSPAAVMYNYDLHPKKDGFLEYYFSLQPLKKFSDELNNLEGTPKVLDLGSGAGLESSKLRELLPEASLTSVDISSAGTNSGKKVFNLEQIQGDVNSPPFADNTFNGIHCKDVLVHIPDKEVFLKRISRILAPNGVLLLVSSKRAWPGYVQYEWDENELVKIAEKNGLELVSSMEVDMEKEDWYSVNNNRIFMQFRKPLLV